MGQAAAGLFAIVGGKRGFALPDPKSRANDRMEITEGRLERDHFSPR